MELAEIQDRELMELPLFDRSIEMISARCSPVWGLSCVNTEEKSMRFWMMN